MAGNDKPDTDPHNASRSALRMKTDSGQTQLLGKDRQYLATADTSAF